MRDAYGNIGRIKVLMPSEPNRAHATQTTPDKAPKELIEAMNATAMSPADTSRTVFSVRAGVKAPLLWVLWSWVPQPVCSALDRRTKGLRVWLWAKKIRRAVVRTVVGWHLIGTVAVIAALPAHAEDGSRSPENRYFQLHAGEGLTRYFRMAVLPLDRRRFRPAPDLHGVLHHHPDPIRDLSSDLRCGDLVHHLEHVVRLASENRCTRTNTRRCGDLDHRTVQPHHHVSDSDGGRRSDLDYPRTLVDRHLRTHDLLRDRGVGRGCPLEPDRAHRRRRRADHARPRRRPADRRGTCQRRRHELESRRNDQRHRSGPGGQLHSPTHPTTELRNSHRQRPLCRRRLHRGLGLGA